MEVMNKLVIGLSLMVSFSVSATNVWDLPEPKAEKELDMGVSTRIGTVCINGYLHAYAGNQNGVSISQIFKQDYYGSTPIPCKGQQ